MLYTIIGITLGLCDWCVEYLCVSFEKFHEPIDTSFMSSFHWWLQYLYHILENYNKSFDMSMSIQDRLPVLIAPTVEMGPHTFADLFIEVAREYNRIPRGLNSFFSLDEWLFDDPQVLAEAYLSQGPGAWVQLVNRLFSTESIFVIGGNDSMIATSSCVNTVLRSNPLPDHAEPDFFRVDLYNLMINKIQLEDNLVAFDHDASPHGLLLTIKEKDFMDRMLDMHLEAIHIVLSDTSWQPDLEPNKYRGYPNILLNIDRDFRPDVFNVAVNKYNFYADSILDLVQNHPYFQELWDKGYTDLAILYEGRWIYNAYRIDSITIGFINPAAGLFSSEDILSTSIDIYKEEESPEDILSTSIDIFKEEEISEESPEDILYTSIDIFEEMSESENYFEDSLWIFEQDE